jgi:hypothetical protein
MITVGRGLATIFSFIIVPAILLGFLGWAWRLSGAGSKYSSDRTEARIYAFWLGISVAVLLIIVNLITSYYNVPNFSSIPQSNSIDTSAITGNIVLGIVAGLVAMAVSRLFSNALAISALIATISCSSLLALYNVILNSLSRDQFLFGTLGALIGALAYATIDASIRTKKS